MLEQVQLSGKVIHWEMCKNLSLKMKRIRFSGILRYKHYSIKVKWRPCYKHEKILSSILIFAAAEDHRGGRWKIGQIPGPCLGTEKLWNKFTLIPTVVQTVSKDFLKKTEGTGDLETSQIYRNRSSFKISSNIWKSLGGPATVWFSLLCFLV